MTTVKVSSLLAAAILAAGSTHLYAEDADNSSLWSGDAEFGYVDTSGNTEETTIKGRAQANREQDEWRYNITFDSLNSTANDARSAEKYFLSNRLAYQYQENDYVFAYASYDDDRFSGFDYQATVSAGWGRRLLDNEVMQWDIELGPGYRISKVDDGANGEDADEAIARGFTQFSWDFSETANFSQSLNVEAGADNTISKSITALKVQIVGALALKLSYTIKYTDEVPAATKRADTETAVTVVYSF
jgi:putative salt-induced outer membrane protein